MAQECSSRREDGPQEARKAPQQSEGQPQRQADAGVNSSPQQQGSRARGIRRADAARELQPWREATDARTLRPYYYNVDTGEVRHSVDRGQVAWPAPFAWGPTLCALLAARRDQVRRGGHWLMGTRLGSHSRGRALMETARSGRVWRADDAGCGAGGALDSGGADGGGSGCGSWTP